MAGNPFGLSQLASGEVRHILPCLSLWLLAPGRKGLGCSGLQFIFQVSHSSLRYRNDGSPTCSPKKPCSDVVLSESSINARLRTGFPSLMKLTHSSVQCLPHLCFAALEPSAALSHFPFHQFESFSCPVFPLLVHHFQHS